MQLNQPFAIASAILILCVSGSLADEFIWDQTNDYYDPDTYRDITNFSPFGQEFTPNMDCLEVIQLQIHNASQDPAKLSIWIHSDSITGTILGTSNTVTLPGYYTGPATFFFVAVLLNPSNLYVMEFVKNEGNALVGSYSPATYPLGRAILFGIPYDGIDLWFREGIFEETALQRLTWGSIKQFNYGGAR